MSIKTTASYILLPLIVLSLIAGCKENKPAAPAQVSQSGDSIVTTDTAMLSDTIEKLSQIQNIPSAADELFDDFFFIFAASPKIQYTRIKFPIPVMHKGQIVEKIDKNKWKMQRFFLPESYYTILLNDESQLESVKDTAVNEATIERITLHGLTLTQYHFNRINSKWYMTAIENKAVEDSTNASFYKFYDHFSTDSTYQISSMNDFVAFTTSDPDDDFQTITGSITPEQWPAFKPEFLPKKMIYNIIYGKKNRGGSKKIFVVRGVSNGIESEFTFMRKSGIWKLTHFSY